MKSEQYYLDKYKPILYLHHKENILPTLWKIKDVNTKITNKHKINKIPYYGVLTNYKDYYIDIIYIFIYPFDKKKFIIVRINKFTEKIIKVLFSKKKEYYREKLDFCKDCNTLKIYVSLNDHQNHVKPNLFYYKTSSKGIYWYPDSVVNIKYPPQDISFSLKKKSFFMLKILNFFKTLKKKIYY